MPLLAVVRIRGIPGRRPEERRTLELLRLHRKFHAVLVRDDPSILGMLKVVENVVTYGEIEKDVLAELIRERGRLTGGKRISEDYLKKIGFESFEELAEALIEGRVDLRNLPDFKPVFRLHPPKGGFRGTIKRHYREGGELGYRGRAINELLLKMI